MISKSFVWYILFKLKICVTRKFEKTLKEMSYFNALSIGLFQGVGVLPGISRSGSTIFGGKVK